MLVRSGRAGHLGRRAQRTEASGARRTVHVAGLPTLPDGREVLGALAERDRTIVPIAFHVDYFNKPWQDVFSDPLYSQRQMVYNQVYTKPKPAEYGSTTHRCS